MNTATTFLRHTSTTRWLIAACAALAFAAAADSSHAQTFTYLACRNAANQGYDFCVGGDDSYWGRVKCSYYYYQRLDYCAQA